MPEKQLEYSIFRDQISKNAIINAINPTTLRFAELRRIRNKLKNI
jgi:hypothetical protein